MSCRRSLAEHTLAALKDPTTYGLVEGVWYCWNAVIAGYESHMLACIFNVDSSQLSVALAEAGLFQGANRFAASARKLIESSLHVAGDHVKLRGAEGRRHRWFALGSLEPIHDVQSQFDGAPGAPQPLSLDVLSDDDAGAILTTRDGYPARAHGAGLHCDHSVRRVGSRSLCLTDESRIQRGAQRL